jgi:hypothetical protein
LHCYLNGEISEAQPCIESQSHTDSHHHHH